MCYWRRVPLGEALRKLESQFRSLAVRKSFMFRSSQNGECLPIKKSGAEVAWNKSRKSKLELRFVPGGEYHWGKPCASWKLSFEAWQWGKVSCFEIWTWLSVSEARQIRFLALKRFRLHCPNMTLVVILRFYEHVKKSDVAISGFCENHDFDCLNMAVSFWGQAI